MKEYEANGIWIFVEKQDEKIHPATFELLRKAQELKAQNNQAVTALLLEPNSESHETTLIGYGADSVLVVKADVFKTFDPMIFKTVVVQLVKKYQPSIFLFAATTLGKALAPRIQGALQTGLTSDCLDLKINEEGLLVQIKPSYGDNLMCTILIPSTVPQMSTIRPHVFKPAEFDELRTGSIIQENISITKDTVYEVLQKTPIETQPDSIIDAEHVVAIGRGIKNKEDCKHLEILAQQLNAKIGVTRPLAENGWYTVNEQIGQSGVTIHPELILNFGISGAIQYTSGMKDAKFVFSVNKDENANIFKESDYGFVGDAKAFAIELSKQLEQK